MNSSYTLFFFLLFVAPIYLIAQSPRIQGYVYNSNTNIPLEGVNIKLINSEFGATTDQKGRFYLTANHFLNPIDTLIFSYVGYDNKKISIEDIKKTNSKVYLEQHIEGLSEFVISANKKLNATIQFEMLAKIPKSLVGFGAVLAKTQNKIYIVGGDESYYEDNLKRRLIEDPSLSNPNSNIADLASKTPGSLNWQHYNGDVLSYDISSNTWEKLDFDLDERAYNNAVLYQDTIYNIGGKRLKPNLKEEYLEDKIELLDLREYKVLIEYTNPHQAINFGSAIFSNNLLLFGGSTKMISESKKIYSKKVHLYNFSSGLWYELKSLPMAIETNGVIAYNKIYLVGGYRDQALKEIGSYSLTTEEYKKEAELFNETARPGLAEQNGIIYIFARGKLLTYNIKLKLLKEYLIKLDIEGAKLILQDGYLYVIGGFIRNNYSQRPSNKMVRINLKTFKTTKVKRERFFSN